jgi:nucleotide-binding universal stress UspA family protein
MTSVAPGSVVVGVDGSPFSDAAVSWAAGYAAAHHAPLVLLHGVGDLGDTQIPYRIDAREMLTCESHGITAHALDLARAQRPEADVSVRAVFEDARAALLGVRHAGMLVVGTRGRGNLRSLVLGSVSQAVIAHAEVPVTVVRHVERPDAGAAAVVVGVALDGSAQSALDVGFEIASMTGRALDAVHAWSTHELLVDTSGHRHGRELRDAHERGFAETMAGYLEKYPDVPVSTRMVDGSAVAALVRESDSAAHVVVGSRSRGRVARHFGSVGRAVVEHGHCPVTVVRPI